MENEILNIPQGNTKEDLLYRRNVIAKFYHKNKKRLARSQPYFCPKNAQRKFTYLGEARGGDFALIELPHPHHGLNLAAKLLLFSDICKYLQEKSEFFSILYLIQKKIASLSRACSWDSDVEQCDAQASLICEIEENEAKSTPAEVELWHRAEPWSTGRPVL